MTEAQEGIAPREQARLEAVALKLATGVSLQDFEISAPLTLLCTGRESSATSTMLTLSGRQKVHGGEVTLHTADGQRISAPRQRAKQIALAGVREIDSLDRNLTVSSVVREAAVWSGPWYAHTPRDIDKIPRWVQLSELLEFTASGKQLVGKLTPSERFILRVIAGLMVRPDPAMLLIDDIDQVHSLEIRAELIDHLKVLSSEFPVVVASSNPDVTGQCDETIRLTAIEER